MGEQTEQLGIDEAGFSLTEVRDFLCEVVAAGEDGIDLKAASDETWEKASALANLRWAEVAEYGESQVDGPDGPEPPEKLFGVYIREAGRVALAALEAAEARADRELVRRVESEGQVSKLKYETELACAHVDALCRERELWQSQKEAAEARVLTAEGAAEKLVAKTRGWTTGTGCVSLRCPFASLLHHCTSPAGPSGGVRRN